GLEEQHTRVLCLGQGIGTAAGMVALVAGNRVAGQGRGGAAADLDAVLRDRGRVADAGDHAARDRPSRAGVVEDDAALLVVGDGDARRIEGARRGVRAAAREDPDAVLTAAQGLVADLGDGRRAEVQGGGARDGDAVVEAVAGAGPGPGYLEARHRDRGRGRADVDDRLLAVGGRQAGRVGQRARRLHGRDAGAGTGERQRLDDRDLLGVGRSGHVDRPAGGDRVDARLDGLLGVRGRRAAVVVVAVDAVHVAAAP